MTNRIIPSALTALFLAASVASAEPLRVAGGHTSRNAPASGIRASMAAVRFEPERARQAGGAYSTPHKNSIATRASGAFAMGVLGVLGGGMFGASIGEAVTPGREGGGLQGVMVGVPVGAVLGAIAGWNLTR